MYDVCMVHVSKSTLIKIFLHFIKRYKIEVTNVWSYVNIHVLMYMYWYFVWSWGGGWFYNVFVIWLKRLFCEGSFANIMSSSYVLWLMKNDHHLFLIITEWYSYSIWSFIWLCSNFLTRYCSEQEASLFYLTYPKCIV